MTDNTDTALTAAVALTIIQVGGEIRRLDAEAMRKFEAIATADNAEKALEIAISAASDKGMAEGMVQTLTMLRTNLGL